MRRASVAGLALALAACLPRGVAAQQHLSGNAGVQMLWADLTEVDSTRSANGPGIGASAWAAYDRWHAELALSYAWLSPRAGASFKAGQWDLRVGYAVIPTLSLEAGVGGRVISPQGAAQDVTTGRIGVRPEIHFARNTSVWGRGAFLVAPRFSGNGDYGLAVELGVGAGIATPDDRFRLRVDYEFQRIDRRIGTTALPIQLAVAKLGAELHWP